ncbi:MAG: hypothetical protein HYW79_03335 [Parcubacteria group bacterium]|nr:hypothetical protein [Parcubacteria group bacterium]
MQVVVEVDDELMSNLKKLSGFHNDHLLFQFCLKVGERVLKTLARGDTVLIEVANGKRRCVEIDFKNLLTQYDTNDEKRR